MATTFGDIEEEVQDTIEDDRFQAGGNEESRILTYANDAVVAMARNIVLPEHRVNGQVSTTTSNYRYDMPTDFLKLLGYETYAWVDVSSKGNLVRKKSVQFINSIDPGHFDTTDSDTPSYWAPKGQRIWIYPMWTGTLEIQDYQRIPTAMVDDGDSPDFPSEGLSGERATHDMVVDYVLSKIYRKWLKEPGMAEPHVVDFRDGLKQIEEYYHLRQFDRKASAG